MSNLRLGEFLRRGEEFGGRGWNIGDLEGLWGGGQMCNATLCY